MKKIMIRADGNARIGAGHLMRCLTIADALGDKECIGFVCADEESAALTEEKGYAAWVLHSDYQNMEAELPAWRKLFGDERSGRRVILVDSYYMTDTYLTQLRNFGRVVVLDDMAKTVWNADVVINYNAFAHEKMYQGLNPSSDTRIYTGGRFIPIRKEFCGSDYRVREHAEHILITTGGGDQDNIAGKILETILWEKCHYHVVTGRFNPHYEWLAGLERLHSNVHIYHDVKNMAQLMEQCDLAVTAGGTTIYELGAIGVPFVCFSYAENQELLTEYIGKNRIAGYGGAYHKEAEQTLAAIREQILELTKNTQLRRAYFEAERNLVDGRGAARIAEIIYSYL